MACSHSAMVPANGRGRRSDLALPDHSAPSERYNTAEGAPVATGLTDRRPPSHASRSATEAKAQDRRCRRLQLRGHRSDRRGSPPCLSRRQDCGSTPVCSSRRQNAAPVRRDDLPEGSSVAKARPTSSSRSEDALGRDCQMPYWYGDERCILEIATATAVWFHSAIAASADPLGARARADRRPRSAGIASRQIATRRQSRTAADGS